MKQLTREQAIQLLVTDEVYNALDLDDFYDEENERYISIYDVLESLGVSGMEIDEALNQK